MSFNIVASSPQAVNETKAEKAKREEMYPFEKLEVGQSFTSPTDAVNWKSLRICVYQRNAREAQKVDGKKFKFINHAELNIVEVARIA